MITLQDIENKRKIDVIQQWIEDLKQGETRQLFLCDLIKENLSDSYTALINAMVQDLLRYCEDDAQQLNGHAHFIRGFCYYAGLGVPRRNNKKALPLLETAIALGHVCAKTQKAIIYLEDDPNSSEIQGLLDEAVALGDARAMVYRARSYKQEATYKTQLPPIVYSLLEQAVAMDYATAMTDLAVIYINKKEFSKALPLLERAKDFGLNRAIFSLASMYEEKQGVLNYETICHLYHQAGLIQPAEALYRSALMHRNISYYAESARLLRQAAMKGHPNALQQLKVFSEEKGYTFRFFYAFHYALHQKNLKEAAKEFTAHFYSHPFEEFAELDFECRFSLATFRNLDSVKNLIDSCNLVMAENKDTYAEFLSPKLYYHTVMALTAWEKKNTCILENLFSLEVDFLSKIKIIGTSYIYYRDLPIIASTIIDTWQRTSGFTQEAARLLSELIYRCKGEFTDEMTPFLENIALILIKALYGENYKINPSYTPIMEDLLVLVAHKQFPRILPIESINFLLGKELIITEVQNALITSVNTASVSASSLGFFTSESPLTPLPGDQPLAASLASS